MADTVLRLLPVVVGIVAGYLLRRLGVVGQRDGETVFTLVFHVFLPGLIFTALSTVDLTGTFALFPVLAVIMIVTGYLAGRLVGARAGFEPTAAAVLTVGCMTVNTGFALPFVQALFGEAGVARLAAFDAVNTTLCFSWAYYTAAKANPRHQGGSLMLGKLARTPPLYAIAAGLLVNLTGVHVPAAVTGPATLFGSAVPVLLPLGVGILFDPLGGDLRRAAVVVGTRLASGLSVGAAVVLAFDLDGVDRTVILLFSVAPTAFSTVTFASLEDLDVGLATTALSLSLVLALVSSLVLTLTLA
jgi:predicted permease